ncbi:MAG: VWA domain-containing protein [Methanomassiliicoccales archaeon]|nr:MAG: VWA domain-containing protein [Methanomassiliicoccales archaeon]
MNSEVEIDILVDIVARPEALPLEIPHATCVVIDQSKSMKGEKIECAKNAAKRVVSMHDPDDMISVFAFSTKVSRLVRPVQAYNYDRIAKAISKVKVKNLTSLYLALEKSGREMTKFGSYISRILMFTDGYPTDEKNPSKYASLARSLFLSGVTSSTVGVSDYNDVILRAISDNGGGWWEHIRFPDEIAEAFSREVQRARSVVVQQPTFCIRLRPNCRVLYAYSSLPVVKSLSLEERPRGFLCTKLPDLSKMGPQQLVFRVSVKPYGSEGESTLGEFRYYAHGQTLAGAPFNAELTHDTELASYLNPRPHAVFALTQAVEKGTRAIELGDKTLAMEAENETRVILDDPDMRRALDETEQGKTKATRKATRAIRKGESVDSKESIFGMRTGK